MATATAAGANELRLFGFPGNLTLASATLAGGEQTELVLPDSLAAFAESRTVALQVRRQRAGGGRLRLRLADTAPPGDYKGELRIASKTYPVSIKVEPAPRLRIFPPSAEFVADPKGPAEVTLTLNNGGNVAIEVPERASIGLFDDEGLETAFADTYRQQTDDPLKLLGHWLGKLREGYGGMFHLHVVSGAGPLGPGAERMLVISTTLREGLRAGHSYHGVWVLGPVNYRVNVTVRK